MCLTLVWDASGADLHVMAWLGNAQGFAWREHWWLSTVLHDGAQRLALVICALVLCMAVFPIGHGRQVPRLQRIEIVLGITLSLLLVSALKRVSMSSCPWELQAYGGVATYSSHWSWGVPDGGSGHCFPGGHASSALAFMAVALPWLGSSQPHERRKGQLLLTGIVFTGLVLGAAQTLRGAHYPSHTAWTVLLCAGVLLENRTVFDRISPKKPPQGALKQRANVSRRAFGSTPSTQGPTK